MLNENYCVEKKIIFVTKQQFVDLLRPYRGAKEGFTAKDAECDTTIDTISAELTKSQLQQRINALLM